MYYNLKLFGVPPWRTLIPWPMVDRNSQLDENRNDWIPFQAEILGASIYFPSVMSLTMFYTLDIPVGLRGEDNMRKSCRPAMGHIALMMNKPLLPQTTKTLESFVTAVCPGLFLLCSHHNLELHLNIKHLKFHCYFDDQKALYSVSDFLSSTTQWLTLIIL